MLFVGWLHTHNAQILSKYYSALAWSDPRQEPFRCDSGGGYDLRGHFNLEGGCSQGQKFDCYWQICGESNNLQSHLDVQLMHIVHWWNCNLSPNNDFDNGGDDDCNVTTLVLAMTVPQSFKRPEAAYAVVKHQPPPLVTTKTRTHAYMISLHREPFH